MGKTNNKTEDAKVNGTKKEETGMNKPETKNEEKKDGFFTKVKRHLSDSKEDWKNIGMGVLKVGSYVVTAAGGFIAGSMLSGCPECDPDDIGLDGPEPEYEEE